MKDEISNNKNKILFKLITILTLLLTIIGKFFSMGWYTVIMICYGIIPIHCILFIKAGKKFAKLENKDKIHYFYYIFMCITTLLYAYTFVDFGDIGGGYTALYKIIKIENLNTDILSEISLICFIASMLLSILLILSINKKSSISKKIKDNP